MGVFAALQYIPLISCESVQYRINDSQYSITNLRFYVIVCCKLTEVVVGLLSAFVSIRPLGICSFSVIRRSCCFQALSCFFVSLPHSTRLFLDQRVCIVLPFAVSLLLFTLSPYFHFFLSSSSPHPVMPPCSLPLLTSSSSPAPPVLLLQCCVPSVAAVNEYLML